MIYGFDRPVEVTTGFHPLDLIGAVAGRKDRFDIDGYSIRLGALERRICSVVLTDKRLRMTAARNMRVYTINRFPLRNRVRSNQPKIFNPAREAPPASADRRPRKPDRPSQMPGADRGYPSGQQMARRVNVPRATTYLR